MKTIKLAGPAVILIAIIIAAPACRKGDFSKQENEAVVIATAWLHEIDDGKYAQSWAEGAGIFKKTVSQERWIRLMAGLRKPLGRMVLRNLASREYATSLPGAPDGEYVVITFRTTFRNKKRSVETVTPMKDTDGKWRVSGYYIR